MARFNRPQNGTKNRRSYTGMYAASLYSDEPLYTLHPPPTYSDDVLEHKLASEVDRNRRSSSLECHHNFFSPQRPAPRPALPLLQQRNSNLTRMADASTLPPRSSSLQNNHRRDSQTNRSSHQKPALPTVCSSSRVEIADPRPSSPAFPLTRASITSPMSGLTMVQFQRGIYPILCSVGARMYQAKLRQQAYRGSRDLLKVKPPTIEQTARQAELLGWNLGWEGWKWS